MGSCLRLQGPPSPLASPSLQEPVSEGTVLTEPGSTWRVEGVLSSQTLPTPTILLPADTVSSPSLSTPSPAPARSSIPMPSCRHAHRSWAGCQSHRLTSQTGTARLGNCRHNGVCGATCSPGISGGRAHPCWEQAAGRRCIHKKSHEGHTPWSAWSPRQQETFGVSSLSPPQCPL